MGRGFSAEERLKGQENDFSYLGDTAWELFHRLNREEADRYLDDRTRKGFTVIQAVALAELDGLNTPNAYGHRPLDDAAQEYPPPGTVAEDEAAGPRGRFGFRTPHADQARPRKTRLRRGLPTATRPPGPGAKR
jgi:hypothetical protein